MPRFITVTINPALDRSYSVDNFKLGEVNRASNVITSAGGKGINVARVLKTLGADVVATGFLGGSTGEHVRRSLASEGIDSDFVDITPSETRLAIIVADTLSHEQTVVNEFGPAINEAQWKELFRALDRLLPGSDMVVFSGSLAPGIPNDAYAQLIDYVKSQNVQTLLDTSGEALRHGIEAKPTVVKPNANEMRGLGVINEEDWALGVAHVARTLQKKYGLETLALTDGAGVAAIASKAGVVTAEMPVVEVVSAVGSGDSFAAGLAHSLTIEPNDMQSAIRLASACGCANAMTQRAGSSTLGQINALSGKIIVERHA